MREGRASDTRRRIAAAALELFAAQGFSGTTVAGIAERAGVSAPTIYATFGSKGAIVRALLTQMEDNADVAGWSARIAGELDPHGKLEAFAQWSCALFSSSKAVIAAAHGAVSDPAIVELRDQGNLHRREGLRQVVSALAQAGELRAGLTEQEALDRAWMVTGVELYLNATDGCGWSDADYERWLSALLQEQLLDATAYRGAPGRLTSPVIDRRIGFWDLRGLPPNAHRRVKMSNAHELVNSYIAMWNETDPERRRDLVAQTVTADARYLDPMMTGEGIDGISDMIAGAQQQFPDHRFTLIGGPDVHHEQVRFSWSLAANGGEPVAIGCDFAAIAEDGRMRSIVGFLEPAA